jgi:DNA-binding CsgD family transcriptional regulator
VRLVAAGQSSKAIARTLDISPQTVDTHRRRILKKLDLHSSAEVVRYAIRSGLLA